jgi:hypothetical protein
MRKDTNSDVTKIKAKKGIKTLAHVCVFGKAKIVAEALMA